MRCPRCGAQNRGANWYCRNCGAAFGDLNVADSVGRRGGGWRRTAWLLVGALGVAGLVWAGVQLGRTGRLPLATRLAEGPAQQDPAAAGRQAGLPGVAGAGTPAAGAFGNRTPGIGPSGDATAGIGTPGAGDAGGGTPGALSSGIGAGTPGQASRARPDAAAATAQFGTASGAGAVAAFPPVSAGTLAAGGGQARPTPVYTPDPRYTTEPGFQNAWPFGVPEVSVMTPEPPSGPTLDPRSYPVAGLPPQIAVPPRIRPDAPVWRIPFRAAPPKLDGWLDDWSGPPLEIGAVVFGSEHWNGPEDLSAKAFGAWDTTALYLGVRVTDDIFSQPSHGEALFLGDSLEIQVDANLERDWAKSSYDEDDWQIGVSPGNFAGQRPEVHVWRPALRDAAGARVAARRVDDGYIIELAMPWAVLGVDVTRVRAVGLALNVSDDDLPKAAQMTMISSSPKRSYFDPRTFGTLVLDSLAAVAPRAAGEPAAVPSPTGPRE